MNLFDKRIYHNSITIVLPMPPSKNRLYGIRGKSIYMKKDGIDYINLIKDAVKNNVKAHPFPLMGRVKLNILVFSQPNKNAVSETKKTNVDVQNIIDILCDAIQDSGIILDDNQIDSLNIERSFMIDREKEEYIVLKVAKI